MKTINVADNDTFTLPVPSSICLDCAPELPLLALLEAAAVISERALAAAHPEIGTLEDCHSAPQHAPLFPGASACTASSIIMHLDALRFGIASYRRSRDRELPGVASVHPNNYPF